MADADVQNVALPPVADLDALDPIRDQLMEAIDQGAVEVDAGSVERVATNALLMLISAAETAQRGGTSFSITAPSDQLIAAVESLGLGESFTPLLKG